MPRYTQPEGKKSGRVFKELQRVQDALLCQGKIITMFIYLSANTELSLS